MKLLNDLGMIFPTEQSKQKRHYGIFECPICKNGYTSILSIDRKDNDKGYSPSNCRWVDKNIQSRNTRLLMITNTSGYRGVSPSKSKKKFRTQITVNKKVIYLGEYEDKLSAAKAYDSYVIENSLEHTLNGVL